MATKTVKQACCPECGSKMWKIGTRVQNRKLERKQVYRCTKCSRATGNPVFRDVKITDE